MPRSSILIIDDEPNNFDVIEAFLANQNYILHYAQNGQSALDSLDLFKPDLILLDFMMPGMDGIEFLGHLKSNHEWDTVPVIMVTALNSKADMAKVLAAGADDFISKPINRLELKSRVRSMIRIRQQYLQLASFNARLEALVEERTNDLQRMLYWDSLTDLPSRSQLLQLLSHEIKYANQLALVYLDCDQFKLVNSSFGHGLSDQLLVAIADRLKDFVDRDHILARMGEDEFCFLVKDYSTEAQLHELIHKVLNSFNKPFSVENCEFFMTVSIGVSIRCQDDNQAEKLLQDADTAMYQAKVKGKGSYQVFDRQMYLDVFERLTLETDLQKALAREEFFLHYQPIINLESEELAGFEALIRWKHPNPSRGIVSPGIFIPSLETTGLIVPAGIYVLRTACQQLQRWHQNGHPGLTMSVNLSVRQFSSPTLLQDIDHVLADTQVDPACLKLEITESAIMDNAENALHILTEIRKRRIQISIDDFGTGYSSLGYLHRFPVNTLKIDRSFINEMENDSKNFHVVQSIITLSQQLGLDVIAEGIETSEQLNQLQQFHCQYGQGYFFSKPCPTKEIESSVLPQKHAVMI